MSAQPQPRLTPEQYLELERASEFRNEYYAGHVYAMSGGTHRHALLIGNITRHVGNALSERSCMVTPSDLRVRTSAQGLYTYPDVVVVCGQPKYADDQKDTLLNPILIVEVVSPSTEAYDRGFKAAQYRTIASLQEYVLVSQTEPRVETFRRQPGGAWLLWEAFGLGTVCRLDSLDCQIAIADIYGQVTFSTEEPIPPRPPVS
jgi:Uma2 family endonuclease